MLLLWIEKKTVFQNSKDCIGYGTYITNGIMLLLWIGRKCVSLYKFISIVNIPLLVYTRVTVFVCNVSVLIKLCCSHIYVFAIFEWITNDKQFKISD